jgi:NAD(P)-dependent dehydrogenase (short-subunit alcohol dehydrogenase family)
MSKILVTGSSSGLGKLIADELSDHSHIVYGYDIRYGMDVRSPDLQHISELDILINCAGINGNEWLEDIDDGHWDSIIDTNAKGIYKMSQAALPFLIRSKGTILNIVSNASHMPMTCSLAYNASKGAAEIMTKQMARELTRKYGITVFGISPNRLKGTAMSAEIDSNVLRTRGWDLEKVREYQKQSLLTGEETDPKQIAEFIAFLLNNKNRHKYLTGCIIPYGL